MEKNLIHKNKSLKHSKIADIFMHNRKSTHVFNIPNSRKNKCGHRRANSIHIDHSKLLQKSSIPAITDEISGKYYTRPSKLSSFFERKTVNANKKANIQHLLKSSFNISKPARKYTSKAELDVGINTLERFINKEPLSKDFKAKDNQRLDNLKAMKAELELLDDSLNNNAFLGNNQIAINIYNSILKKHNTNKILKINSSNTNCLNKKLRNSRFIYKSENIDQDKETFDKKRDKHKALGFSKKFLEAKSVDKLPKKDLPNKTISLLNSTQKQIDKKLNRRETAVQTEQDTNTSEFINHVRVFCIEYIRKNSDTPICFEDFMNYLALKNIVLPNINIEYERLFYILLDCEQKHIIYDKIMKTMMENSINIEMFSKVALNNIALINDFNVENKAIKKAIESFYFGILLDKLTVTSNSKNNSTSKDKFNLRENMRKYYKSQISRKPKKLKAYNEDLSIDLVKLNTKEYNNKTPKGFHQEFSEMADEFSLSWRLQMEKEKRYK